MALQQVYLDALDRACDREIAVEFAQFSDNIITIAPYKGMPYDGHSRRLIWIHAEQGYNCDRGLWDNLLAAVRDRCEERTLMRFGGSGYFSSRRWSLHFAIVL